MEGNALGRKMASATSTANAPMSKIRSTAQTASCDEKGSSVRRAIRYGRMNSPARPSSAIPANPTSVGDTNSATTYIRQFRRIGDTEHEVQACTLLDRVRCVHCALLFCRQSGCGRSLYLAHAPSPSGKSPCHEGEARQGRA